MTPLEIRNSALNLYVSKGILLVTSVFAFCPPHRPSENLDFLLFITVLRAYKAL